MGPSSRDAQFIQNGWIGINAQARYTRDFHCSFNRTPGSRDKAPRSNFRLELFVEALNSAYHGLPQPP
jgi:hypothetical protein